MHGGPLLIAVRDFGNGIDPEDLPHIFDRYYRAARERATEGLGLGLAISRMLVEAHGGIIAAESAVGRGSTFRVWLAGAPPQDADRVQPNGLHCGPPPFSRRVDRVYWGVDCIQSATG